MKQMLSILTVSHLTKCLCIVYVYGYYIYLELSPRVFNNAINLVPNLYISVCIHYGSCQICLINYMLFVILMLPNLNV